MYVPILRKTITLANLSTTTISVRTILSLHKRRVDLPATLRTFQRMSNLLFRSEHRPIVNLLHSPLHTRLMNRRIYQILRRTITRLLRSTSFAHVFLGTWVTKRFKNCLFVRLIFITRDQSRRFVFQASRRFSHQPFRILFRPLAIDHFQYEFVFGIQGNVIPVVATTSVSRIVCVAVFLFLLNEVPFLVELNLFGQQGKKPRVRREVFRNVRQQVWYND